MTRFPNPPRFTAETYAFTGAATHCAYVMDREKGRPVGGVCDHKHRSHRAAVGCAEKMLRRFLKAERRSAEFAAASELNADLCIEVGRLQGTLETAVAATSECHSPMWVQVVRTGDPIVPFEIRPMEVNHGAEAYDRLLQKMERLEAEFEQERRDLIGEIQEARAYGDDDRSAGPYNERS